MLKSTLHAYFELQVAFDLRCGFHASTPSERINTIEGVWHKNDGLVPLTLAVVTHCV